MKNHGILWDNLTKPPVARKQAVGHLFVRQLVMVSSFNNKMHAWSTSMLLLLHSAFMLNVVKMLLKGEVGGHGIVMEITLMIMEFHGKIMELCFWISVGTLYTYYLCLPSSCHLWTSNDPSMSIAFGNLDSK